MRYRKSISICKGLRVNVSKSGLSLTAGGHGLSMTASKKGLYANAGIPGTGIYDRKRINLDPPKTNVKVVEQQPLQPAAVNTEAQPAGISAEDKSAEMTEIYKNATTVRTKDWYQKELDEPFVRRAGIEGEDEREAHFKRFHEALPKMIAGEDIYIESIVEKWLGEVTLPVSFHLNYEYSNGKLDADVQLPQDDELPLNKEGYARCVFGLAIFFASHLFNISPVIDTVSFSGFRKERDQTTGDLNNDCIYSINFDRETMSEETDYGEDPIAYCMKFQNRCLLSKAFNFKKVVAYE